MRACAHTHTEPLHGPLCTAPALGSVRVPSTNMLPSWGHWQSVTSGREPLLSREDMSQVGIQPELRRATGLRRGSGPSVKQDTYSGGIPDSWCPTPIQHQSMGSLKLELHNTCYEPSLADSPNSFSLDNLHKIHFFALLVSPADRPPPQQQGFSVHPVKASISLLMKKNLFTRG